MPDNQEHSPKLITQFEDAPGIEFVLHGELLRHNLARTIIDNLSSISATAIHLLESFMKECGVFDLQSVEVFELQTRETGDFVLSFIFTAHHDPHDGSHHSAAALPGAVRRERPDLYDCSVDLTF